MEPPAAWPATSPERMSGRSGCAFTNTTKGDPLRCRPSRFRGTGDRFARRIGRTAPDERSPFAARIRTLFPRSLSRSVCTDGPEPHRRLHSLGLAHPTDAPDRFPPPGPARVHPLGSAPDCDLRQCSPDRSLSAGGTLRFRGFTIAIGGPFPGFDGLDAFATRYPDTAGLRLSRDRRRWPSADAATGVRPRRAALHVAEGRNPALDSRA